MIRFVFLNLFVVLFSIAHCLTPENLSEELREKWEKKKYLNSFDGKNISEEILWNEFVEQNDLLKKKVATPAGAIDPEGAAGSPPDTAAGPPDTVSGSEDLTAGDPLKNKGMQNILKSIPPEKRKRLEDAIKSGNKAAMEAELKSLASLESLKAMSSKENAQSLVTMLQDQWRDKSILDTTRDLKKSLAGSVFQPVFDNIPKSYEFMATMIKDTKALPSAFSTVGDKKRLLYFLGANILVFFIGKFIKRNYNRGNHNSGGVSQSTLLSQLIMRLTMTTAMRIGLVVYFFGTELKPTWHVFKQVYF